jgi:16S rRNA (guanine966-N2)-methyltransferase
LRIIGGIHKRRVLKAPGSLPVRPTTDMAKEALFSILNNHIDFEGLRVLDLFAGTGNISYEFASRGAAQVVAVDQHMGCINFIKKTATQLDFTCLAAVKADAFRFLNFCHQDFDLIFADPPYDLKDIRLLPEVVFNRKLLIAGGLMVVEHGADTRLNRLAHFREERKYGKVRFSFFAC